ncbi:hypothetical protein HDV04_005612 [Boothiomyces sp. JEL0838]|nr:hypothetical protein HDV04_005612 [Boothiomyces sp. JEL0838]
MVAVTTLSFLASIVASYSLCDKTNYPYAGQSISIKLVPTVVGVQINNQTVQTGVSGSVSIVDGCDIQLSSDFTLSSGLTCYWYGGQINGPKDGSDGITLSTSPVTSGTAGAIFPFVTSAGNFVSFKDFSQFRLFHKDSQTVIATADITAGVSTRVVGSAPNATSTTSVATATANSAVATPTKNSAIQNNFWIAYAILLLNSLGN